MKKTYWLAIFDENGECLFEREFKTKLFKNLYTWHLKRKFKKKNIVIKRKN